jgi:hypothetical protein
MYAVSWRVGSLYKINLAWQKIGALRELLFEKGIISEEEFTAKCKKLDREMKERTGKIPLNAKSPVSGQI